MKYASTAKKFGDLLADEFKKDPHFYFFSPDETTSNKFDQIFTVEKRAWNLPQESWDLPEGQNGRIDDWTFDERRDRDDGQLRGI